MAYKNKEDQLRSWREHYERNKEYYAKRNKRRKAEKRAWLNSLKIGPCTICKRSYPSRALDWHHRDSKTRTFQIANAINLGYGKDRILREIEKCDIICASCHRTL